MGSSPGQIHPFYEFPLDVPLLNVCGIGYQIRLESVDLKTELSDLASLFVFFFAMSFSKWPNLSFGCETVLLETAGGTSVPPSDSEQRHSPIFVHRDQIAFNKSNLRQRVSGLDLTVPL